MWSTVWLEKERFLNISTLARKGNLVGVPSNCPALQTNMTGKHRQRAKPGFDISFWFWAPAHARYFWWLAESSGECEPVAMEISKVRRRRE